MILQFTGKYQIYLIFKEHSVTHHHPSNEQSQPIRRVGLAADNLSQLVHPLPRKVAPGRAFACQAPQAREMMCAMSAPHTAAPTPSPSPAQAGQPAHPAGGVDPARTQALLARGKASIARNPRSQAQAARTAQHLMFGVPLHWMNDWATPFALHMAQAQGAHPDRPGRPCAGRLLPGRHRGHVRHSPPVVMQALAAGQPGLHRHAGQQKMPPPWARHWPSASACTQWQFAMTATDANRFVLRWLRAAGGPRGAAGVQRLLPRHGGRCVCRSGTASQRDSLLGQVHDLTRTTRVVEFNDLAALEAALAPATWPACWPSR